MKTLNSWWPRFWAWLIDSIIIWLVTTVLFLDLSGPDFLRMSRLGIIALVYWTLLESDGRVSIGKKAMNIKLVKINGKKLTVMGAAISAFGKAFILPLDFIIGVLARPGKKQRLFNIASDTVAVERK